jgi:ribosomal protein S27E
MVFVDGKKAGEIRTTRALILIAATSGLARILENCKAMKTDGNFIDCKCPGCGGAVSFPDDVAGRVEKCPNCTGDLVVPADGSETAGRMGVG